MMLETIPSFSYSTLRGRYEDEDEEDEDQSDVQDEEERAELEENVAAENGHFGLSNKMENMVLTEEVRVMDRIWSVNFEGKREWISEEMHLARGPGIDCGSNGNGGGGGYGGRSGGGSGDEFGSGGGDMHGTEEYYKKMVQENPGNPLFLRNYAQFLCQTKRDLQGAEEYYSRAILADPKDGEILSQYGKLVWELHQDQDRASSYFERGVQASPEDCHVHAAYASFLWETEDADDDVECKVPPKDFDAKPPHFHEGAVAFARGQAVN